MGRPWFGHGHIRAHILRHVTAVFLPRPLLAGAAGERHARMLDAAMGRPGGTPLSGGYCEPVRRFRGHEAPGRWFFRLTGRSAARSALRAVP